MAEDYVFSSKRPHSSAQLRCLSWEAIISATCPKPSQPQCCSHRLWLLSRLLPALQGRSEMLFFWCLRGCKTLCACVRLMDLLQILSVLSHCFPCPPAQMKLLGYPEIKSACGNWCMMKSSFSTGALTHSHVLPVWICVVWSVPFQPVLSNMPHSSMWWDSPQ